ncbi:MAG: hypothetical protein ACRDGG_03020 [Anaerolineae bacterium]
MPHELTSTQIGDDFVKLNRALTWAENLEAWRPADQAMQELLGALESAIDNGALENAWTQSTSAKVFSILLTLMAEAGQYRHETYRPAPETDQTRYRMFQDEVLPGMGRLRAYAVKLAKKSLSRPVFASVSSDIEEEIFPLLDDMDPAVAPDRYMPFRVIHVSNIVERLYSFRFRTDDPYLAGNANSSGLLQGIYERKYLRFGTSGVRGRWGRDFTEMRAKQVVQAICDFLKNQDGPPYAAAENLLGRRVVIGYDSRLNARLVASWAAQVCLANGFTVDLANRDSPTPALVYYMTDYLGTHEVAGLINCTASHNPPEWQGIKFNPRLGYPAPTNLTDFIASRINEIQILDRPISEVALDAEVEQGRLRGFDPIDLYTYWIRDSGYGNSRIALDFDRIRKYFGDQLVVVDEMHGAGRGYLTRLLGEIGVRHTVIHAETDPTLPGLDYANPEEPFIKALKEKVKESGAILGLGMDTDADRFGIVDRGGIYLRPNQILPMLVRYLGVDRGLNGRVIATQTGSPLIESLAGMIKGNEAFKPETGVIPAYIDHPFYQRRVGQRGDRVYANTFMVPVGIKYIEEQRRTDRRYRTLPHLPDDWRSVLLIGGEESSGLTTRGHVTDKDGIWANLLVMDMLAYYGALPDKQLNSLTAIWQDTCQLPGCWLSYGGRERQDSNTGRADVDAILEAKEDLISFYLDLFSTTQPDNTLAGLDVVYAGGVRYDICELQLRDAQGDDRHFLRVRSSGTEPINRIYVESSSPEIAQQLMQTVLDKLEELIAREISQAQTEWRLVDVLTLTQMSPRLQDTVRKVLGERGWSAARIIDKLKRVIGEPNYLEYRNKRMADSWAVALKLA